MTIEEFKQKLADYVGSDESERGIDLLDAFAEVEMGITTDETEKRVREVEEKWKKRYIERFLEPIEKETKEETKEVKEEKIENLFE